MSNGDPKWYRDQKRDDDVFCIVTGGAIVAIFVGALYGILNGGG